MPIPNNRATKISHALGMSLAVAAFSPAVRAHAAPLDDPYGTFTAQVENDAVSTLKGTSDQYYTSGLRLGWTSGTNNQPPAISNLNRLIWGDGTQRIALGLQQSIFTPRDTQSRAIVPNDRPYAGVLLATVNLLSDTDLSRSVAGIQAGVMGSYAGGYQVQNGFHSIIGDTPNLGWRHQLPNQPILQIQAGRIWRLPLISRYGLSTDVLPEINGAAGDFRTYGQLGATFRIGQGLDSDFGTPRISPGLDGTDAYKQTRPFAWYAFAGVDGQAVGYDATLQGSTFRSGEPHVSKVWDVGEMEAGAAFMFHGVRVSYTQTWQTQEFKHAKAGLFNFGSLALSAKF
ncbi:lipid A deacylase LpxR family protein [Acetobacteraceae bacterium KSS8]|uniref:Lipid A deacylase LpxR family protein n=2 Tax=Endosaccharibacter trunci TaxID=2812733 RepID=A0ABT1WBD8_9PROT|nr:lipid A deacylase LpxR family protein [Acetobacteraceae bacterium KSS8]